jgi:hypothetical protein
LTLPLSALFCAVALKATNENRKSSAERNFARLLLLPLPQDEPLRPEEMTTAGATKEDKASQRMIADADEA